MKNDDKNIICPKCGESISIDDALTHQIENKLKKEYEDKEKSLRESIEKESSKKLEQNKTEMEKKIKTQILKEAEVDKVASDEKNKFLEEQLADKEAKLKEARQNELALIKGNQKLKDDQESFELEKTRQLAEERKQIEEDASKKATDAKQSEIDQLNKKLSDATKAKDELARKLEQGSQQTQGEVQELALEELLKDAFIYDDVSPVGKGVNGADVIQIVKTKSGVDCGKIIWESKKTKTWTENWIQKLKDDQRQAKADLAVIITSVMPQGTSGITHKDGVWICDIKLALSIATLLRHSLETVAREKSMSIGKNEKVEILYTYLTGTEFKQRIEVIVDTFSNMKKSLEKEKLYFTKTWAEKEKQIDRVIQNTVGIYGDLSGVVQLQKIESLELPEPSKEQDNL
jgi:hypothetical protein